MAKVNITLEAIAEGRAFCNRLSSYVDLAPLRSA